MHKSLNHFVFTGGVMVIGIWELGTRVVGVWVWHICLWVTLFGVCVWHLYGIVRLVGS